MRVAVVGAGVAGLSCARWLAKHGVDVTVFDKGRGVGGRLATRRAPPHAFDLGAQYFTVRDPRFQGEVVEWRAAGACARWDGRFVALDESGGSLRAVDAQERLVGTPDMSAIARHMALGLDVRASHRVDQIVRRGQEIVLTGTAGPAGVTLPWRSGGAAAGAGTLEELGAFDFALMCLPANQAAPLVEPVSSRLAAVAHGVTLEPCFAVGLVPGPTHLRAIRALPFDGIFVGREPHAWSALSWVARNSSKPGRPPSDCFVLHASASWSSARFDVPEADVGTALAAEFARLFNLGHLDANVACVRRWSFARAPHPLDAGVHFDGSERVGLAGDWLRGGRVEGAFLSGRELAARVLMWSGDGATSSS